MASGEVTVRLDRPGETLGTSRVGMEEGIVLLWKKGTISVVRECGGPAAGGAAAAAAAATSGGR